MAPEQQREAVHRHLDSRGITSALAGSYHVALLDIIMAEVERARFKFELLWIAGTLDHDGHRTIENARKRLAAIGVTEELFKEPEPDPWDFVIWALGCGSGEARKKARELLARKAATHG